MMYFTSDLHLYHKNILNFCRETRPYADLTEMRHKLIDEINATCQANDTLYHLGDFYFGKSQDELRVILSEIKCRIHFIRGNHDYSNHVKVMKEFGHVDDYLELKDNGRKLILCHYPLAQWNGCHYGTTYHFYGHCHGSFENVGKSIDVGWDAQGKILSLQEAIDLCNIKG